MVVHNKKIKNCVMFNNFSFQLEFEIDYIDAVCFVNFRENYSRVFIYLYILLIYPIESIYVSYLV